jgi:hypothetical protein
MLPPCSSTDGLSHSPARDHKVQAATCLNDWEGFYQSRDGVLVWLRNLFQEKIKRFSVVIQTGRKERKKKKTINSEG